MDTTLGPSPGAARHPMHTLQVVPSDRNWTVSLGEKLLAQSDKTLVLEESGYNTVVYFPPQDVRVDSLIESSSLTTCPFKGEANYFAAEINGKCMDIAWQYGAVYNEVGPIAGYIAFYADRVQIESESIDEG